MGRGSQALVRIADASEVAEARRCGTVFRKGPWDEWGLRLSAQDVERLREGAQTVQACRANGEVVEVRVGAVDEDEGLDEAGRPWASLSHAPAVPGPVRPPRPKGADGRELPSMTVVDDNGEVVFRITHVIDEDTFWKDRVKEQTAARLQVREWAQESLLGA